jgi:hypothetical protein
MSYPYRRLDHFIERLNRFKCVKEYNTEYNARDMLTDKYDKNYCEKCVKQVIKSNKNIRLRYIYHSILDERFYYCK